MSQEQFIIGIDLGTTNCTMAYARLEDGEGAIIEQAKIPQVIESGVQANALSLPSFIYFPLQEELKTSQTPLSWDPSRPLCVGSFARDRGAEVPSRLISSAKSWLCHSGVDRRQPCLPLDADSNVDKLSPLDATVEILKHLKEAWDAEMPKPFVDQQVLITVPASFDPSARQLVQEAAKKAGYPEAILLEEPQAAFYSWLNVQKEQWRKNLIVGDCVLVIDIGGGTTDFSLISVGEVGGNLTLERLATGSHLLLGGDNIDLSLAYQVKAKFEEQGHSIDDWQFQSLIHRCRAAKEQLLSNSPPKHVDITVVGRGSKLVGGTLKTKLTFVEVKSGILDGFTPLVPPEEMSRNETRSGLQEVGLPYAQDPRLTCQLAKFLSMTGEGNTVSLDSFVLPTAVLFNGGTMKAPALRERLLEQLNQWAKSLDKPSVTELSDADYDFSVSQGAVNYGKARNGHSIRIKSKTCRSFFIGVEDAALAVPGVPRQLKAICVAPFGLEEGTKLELEQREFTLVLGKMATFRFFSHSTPKLDSGIVAEMGTVVKDWKRELTELHPIETCLDSPLNDGKTIRVKIRSRITELGVLEVYCVAEDDQEWKLEFDVRKEVFA